MTDEPAPNEDALEAGRLLFAGDATFVLGVANLKQLPPSDRTEVCFAGRSNVGKSSLINALTNRAKLARSSAEPGRTRELNYFDVGQGQLYLVDLPGFGYAKVSRSQAEAWTKLTKAYLRGRPSLRRVFLLVDARRGLMET
ncbi:MAG TPA: ribosome biogenesis GTP-binding protein YihA/YsxC, partial [Hyphomonas sp.]|nr:ribosome biogenesis GTP-binding protein YihA/YsxC [Hyphomonas sp.]